MSNYTPMIQQYLSVKAEVPDAFLFFRLGDFYEMFFDDAIQASKELEITLTGRGGGTEEKIPMCGVPHHAAEQYITRLIEKGYKIAICEQVEDPSEAKGVVRREIVRIVTPGTVMEGKTVADGANNYLVCIAAISDQIGFVSCDLSTGELYVTSIDNTVDALLDEINVYTPSELIGEGSLLTPLAENMSLSLKRMSITEWSQGDDPFMERHFGDAVNKLNEAEKKTVSLLLSYLNTTQKRALIHLSEIRQYSNQQHMTMDPFTRRNLELVETVMERSKKGSLLGLLDKTVTSMGGRLLRRWVDKPLVDKTKIEARLEAVDQLYQQLITREDVRQKLKEVYDLERLTARVAYGNANARDLIALKVSLEQVPGIKEDCTASGSSTLRSITQEIDECRDVLGWIEAAIVDEPPVSVRDGGIIKAGYHEHLDQLREASQHGKQWIAELEKTERERTGIKSLKIGYNKVFGYYIEITKANLNQLEEGRYERKQTLSNAERYITPELKEKESLILEAQDKMVLIEYELFTQLRDQLAGELHRLQKLASKLAEIDVYQSLATVSAANHYKKPQITEKYDLTIVEGKHPVVDALMKDQSFIANDAHLSQEETRMLLITGPNMAGKSTYMRQVAMIIIMAQMGCFVPAKEAMIPVIDHIFTRIGAADDLIGGQSTFMVEMVDIRVMTEKATPKSLVIIDELGRGTSTSEGMAIAQAVIEYLHHQIGCKTLVSTHFHELAHLEESLTYLRNYSMSVKESGNQVTFLRKLIEGAASTSYGIYCAQIAGLPNDIIHRSYDLLSSLEARAITELGSKEAASSSDIVQLSLFEDKKTNEQKKEKDKLSKTGVKKEEQEILDRIQAVDLINMTPLEAMNFIFELKKKVMSNPKE